MTVTKVNNINMNIKSERALILETAHNAHIPVMMDNEMILISLPKLYPIITDRKARIKNAKYLDRRLYISITEEIIQIIAIYPNL